MMQGTEEAGGGPERRLLTSLRWATFALFALAGMALLVRSPPGVPNSPNELARYFAAKQDIPVLAAMILFFLQFNSPARLVGQARGPVLRNWQVVAVLLAMTLLAWFLRTQILFDYDLSRDEKMATFDAAIFANGRLFWPIPPDWRASYDALNTLFILPVGDREGWVSSYLPVNAALRALAGKAIAPSLISPLLVLVAGLALWRIARRLWPDSPGTQAVVLVLFAGSSQVILMGMTSYAMTPHLAFNLVWLWLFLQRRPAAHAGAMLVGFLATGLHQPVFHPLFVLPFLDLLRREKAWKALAAYVLCYGAIGLFWLSWPGWVSAQGMLPAPAAISTDGIGFVDRLARGSIPLSVMSLWLMAANLMRFFAWQHVLLLPLAIVAWRGTARTDPLFRALWLGIALMLALVTVILPVQVHGWGYRYLHGFIGSAVLIAGFGWHWLEQRKFAPARGFAWATALSVLVILPVHVWMARSMIAPFARASAALARIPADIVVVDTATASFAGDLVLNRADLSNRPILLDSEEVMADDMPDLCEGRTIGFADTPMFAELDRTFGISPNGLPSPRQRQLEAAARTAGCRIVGSPKG